MQIELTQSPERYSYKSGVWKISAKSDIKPITITEGELTIELLPLLSVSGVIVHLKGTDKYLASIGMIEDLKDSMMTNPHYSYKEHSKILGAKMGKTIPIIEVKVDGLEESVSKQKLKGKNAGVKEVKWSIENDYKGLIEQINWTLSPNSNKPKDNYKIFDLNLLGDYSVNALPITPLDENARIPEDILANNLKIINDRIVQLRADFNSIKDVFYMGLNSSPSSTTYDVLASSEGEELSVQVVTKTSSIVSKSDLPSTQLADTLAVVKTELETKIAQNTATQAEPPPVIRLKMRKKRDVKTNRIPVFENNPSTGDKGARKRIIKEGDIFWGYFVKDWANGKIWAVYEPDKTTLVGYGIADRNDFVDPI